MNVSQETIRTVIGVATLVCAGVGVYAGIRAELSTQTISVKALATRTIELDKYDILLQKNMGDNKARIIRLEAQMEGQSKNYDRLIDTMDNLGDKLELLGNKITEIKVKK